MDSEPRYSVFCNTLEGMKQLPHILFLLLLVVYCLAVVLLYKDYPIAIDEPIEVAYAEYVKNQLAPGTGLEKFYRPYAFDDPQASQYTTNYYAPGYKVLTAFAAELVDTESSRFETGHLVNGLLGSLLLLSVYVLSSTIAGPWTALLAVVLLLLSPRVVGQLFVNPKDPPFAAMYSFALWTILLLVKQGARPRVRTLVLSGVFIGACASTRSNGLSLLILSLIAFTTPIWRCVRTKDWQQLARILGYWLIIPCITWAVLLATWPWAQEAPFVRPLQSLFLMSNYAWNLPVLYDGAFIPGTQLPRTYFFVWFLIGTPLIVLFAIAIAAFQLWPRVFLQTKDNHASNNELYIARKTLAILFAIPLCTAIALNSPKYDGLRHFLFLYPTILAFSALSIRSAYRTLRGKNTIVAGLFVVLVAGLAVLPIQDMLRLHPYEYAYTNELVGGNEGSCQRFESEYWMLSISEAVSWLSPRLGDGEQVYLHDILQGRLIDAYRIEYPGFPWSASKSESEYRIASSRFGNCANGSWPILQTFGRKNCVFACVSKRAHNDTPAIDD